MNAVTTPPPATHEVLPGCPGSDVPHTHSAEDTAQLIGGVTARTLLARAGRREIPSTRVGSEVRFTDDHIAEIITAGERRPAPRTRRDSRRRS